MKIIFINFIKYLKNIFLLKISKKNQLFYIKNNNK